MSLLVRLFEGSGVFFSVRTQHDDSGQGEKK